MKIRSIFSLLVMLVISASLSAQSTEKQSKKDIKHTTIKDSDIQLVKDNPDNLDPSKMLEQQMSPERALEHNYANAQTSEEWQQKDSQRGKLGDVKVVTPEAYEALSAEEKTKIDQNPTFFVTEMTRKQAMAAFVNGKLTKDKPVEPQEAEKAVPVTEPHK